jgi:hypothetical protein
VLLKFALVVGGFVFVDDVFPDQAVEFAFDLVQQGGGFVGVFQFAQCFHFRANAPELPAVAGAAFLVLADALGGRGALGHGKGGGRGKEKRETFPKVDAAPSKVKEAEVKRSERGQGGVFFSVAFSSVNGRKDAGSGRKGAGRDRGGTACTPSRFLRAHTKRSVRLRGFCHSSLG